ncbi:hypothetical protein THAOC_32870, partial [Thalassiosira oceanica]
MLSRPEIAAAILFLAVALGPLLPAATALSVGRGDVAGVWRLSPGPSLLPSEKGDAAAVDAVDPAAGVDVVLVLKADGSFGRCRDTDGERAPPSFGSSEFVLDGVRRGGLWDYDVDRKEAILFPDRPADARKVHDLVLCGAVGQGRETPAANVAVLGSLSTGLPSDGDGDEGLRDEGDPRDVGPRRAAVPHDGGAIEHSGREGPGRRPLGDDAAGAASAPRG